MLRSSRAAAAPSSPSPPLRPVPSLPGLESGTGSLRVCGAGEELRLLGREPAAEAAQVEEPSGALPRMDARQSSPARWARVREAGGQAWAHAPRRHAAPPVGVATSHLMCRCCARRFGGGRSLVALVGVASRGGCA
mmetsp:Transcript_7827/g.30907  ORF Transcript_7827/g.30907 Transcript_7827/m.30907 type:complete len:136 (+) Transcript_7827:1756-2163(+)